MKKIIFYAAFFLISYSATLFSGDKPFNLTDAMKFTDITYRKLSYDGNWLMYCVAPDRGDGTYYIKSLNSNAEYKVERGSRAEMPMISNWVAVSVKPKFIDVENAEKPADAPKNSLALINLVNGERIDIEKIKSNEFSNDGKWLIYSKHLDTENKKEDKKSLNGSNYLLRHLESKSEILLENVSNFMFDSTSRYFIYTISTDSKANNGIYYKDLSLPFAPEFVIDKDTLSYYSNLTFNNKINNLAFIKSNIDSTNKVQDGGLCLFDFNSKKVTNIENKFNNKLYFIPNKNSLNFNNNGTLLNFGVKLLSDKEKEEKEKKKKWDENNIFDYEKILEKTQLYLWHWNDKNIIPQQMKEWSKNKDRTINAVYLINENKQVVLGDSTLEQVTTNENTNFAMGLTSYPYLKEITWYGWMFDLYVVDVKTGDRKLIREKIEHNNSLSNTGRYILYFFDKHWRLYDNSMGSERNITEDSKYIFWNKQEDRPTKPDAYGLLGWSENDSLIYLYDEYNVISYDISTSKFRNITQNLSSIYTEFRNIRYNRDKKFINNNDTLLFYGMDKKTKTNGIFSVELSNGKLIDSIQTNKNVKFRDYSPISNTILYTIESYEDFPDLYTTKLNSISQNFKKHTSLHEEIKDYNWGRTYLTEWTIASGDTLQGYYILPDTYKKGQKLPVFIYFYESFSDRKNEFITPKISHRPCYQFYVSDDYIMFFPDMKFKTGNPGPSSLESMLAGCRKLVELGIADSTKFVIHGHSWSGYESAYIITQTNFFAACISGAPVSNMTSAYSGIRLGSGLARQFQYETGQSRIGGNLIDSLDSYIRNSPVFFADKVNTPLLIQFGDVDDAVPYSQGVELYLAMRRYNKNCILLQYENEPHHLQKYAHKLDYAIRMKEFSDVYAKSRPAPNWILEGIKYVGKYNK